MLPENNPCEWSVSDNAGAAIDRVTGSILNPYQALQFQGIDLRSHSFRFRCSPNSEKEAEALKAIIQQFKIRMLPEKKGLLFNFPDICTIEFQTRNMPYSFKNYGSVGEDTNKCFCSIPQKNGVNISVIGYIDSMPQLISYLFNIKYRLTAPSLL